MTIVSPVIQLAASETRKATAEAMSAGYRMRPSATEADTIDMVRDLYDV